jgi:hypothetical protein
MDRISKSLIFALATTFFVGTAQAAYAKKWTIYQRQVRLAKEITKGQRSGELTLKEANDLREQYDHVGEKISKMKAKNGGKLSYADQNELEKKLNELSVRIQKKMLAKRVKH